MTFKTQYMALLLMLGLGLATTALAQAANQQVPALVNYQGTLTDENGQLLETGPYAIAFRIYDAVDASDPVWGPQTFPNVPVVNGAFNVILGETDDAGESLPQAFAGAQAYLGITVGNGPEIAPRQAILSAPYALRAKSAPLPKARSAYIPGIINMPHGCGPMQLIVENDLGLVVAEGSRVKCSFTATWDTSWDNPKSNLQVLIEVIRSDGGTVGSTVLNAGGTWPRNTLSGTFVTRPLGEDESKELSVRISGYNCEHLGRDTRWYDMWISLEELLEVQFE